ncbi:MAG: NAD-dependent deacylase [Desulfobacteraceae bacterium]|jgi:NAD-dependent deacetylase|nr:NAD-dependent deacylase [Desulfobacteraceae bacterium]
MEPEIETAAQKLRGAGAVVALTGAGISVESGIPPFRGKGGLWETIDPMEFAHIDRFLEDPGKVWEVLIKGMKETLDPARPNAGHLSLARLEAMGKLQTIITQNVDGLHQAAGSTDVIEFHGNFAWQRCTKCGWRVETARVDLSVLPPRCSCGGVLRPECVFYGEMIPSHHLVRSQSLSASCDLMMVIGTSAEVQPAATMPVIAKHNGATVIEINPESTQLTLHVSDIFIRGGAGEVLSAVVDRLEELL